LTSNRQTLLVFRVGDDGRLAVPLSKVSRLEKFSPTAIERAGARPVVQYRGQILPLIELKRLLGEAHESPRQSSAPVPVVVYAQDGKSVGLVVDEILDIVDDDVLVTRNALRPGTLGAAVIQGRVTELLDAASLIQEEVPNWVQEVELHA
jgi:two-component system chemotaxis sensor kinase CheA